MFVSEKRGGIYAADNFILILEKFNLKARMFVLTSVTHASKYLNLIFCCLKTYVFLVISVKNRLTSRGQTHHAGLINLFVKGKDS